MVEIKEDFQLSKVDTPKPYYQDDFAANNAVLVKRTDEPSGSAIMEFVRLRRKMYSLELVRKMEGMLGRLGSHRVNRIQ